MRFKVGCKIHDLQPQTLLGIFMCDQIYRDFDQELVITSVNDGMHMTGSYHYQGRAFDVRTKSIKDEHIKRRMMAEIGRQLAVLGFDVLLEEEGMPNEHCHIEWDPK